MERQTCITCLKRRGREGIVNERSDLITWRGSYLKRIKEVYREKEPQREIVDTDKTWLNAGHKVKKEWVDLKALEKPGRSIKEFGSVGCTKDHVGKEKRIIIVDRITENGPIPGALWIFSADGQKKKVKKQEKLFEESAVNAEKARENENAFPEKYRSARKSNIFLYTCLYVVKETKI